MTHQLYQEAKEFYFNCDIKNFNIAELLAADKNAKLAISYLEKYFPGDENDQKVWFKFRNKVLRKIGCKHLKINLDATVNNFYQALASAQNFPGSLQVLKYKGLKKLNNDQLFTLLNLIIDNNQVNLIDFFNDELKQRNLF